MSSSILASILSHGIRASSCAREDGILPIPSGNRPSDKGNTLLPLFLTGAPCFTITARTLPSRWTILERLFEAERDENTCREPYTPEEFVHLGARFEELEREAAKERQSATRNVGAARPGKLPERERKSDTRDAVGRAAGVSGRTYEKAKAVVESGDRALIDEMNRTGKVNGAYKMLVTRKKSDEADADAGGERHGGHAHAGIGYDLNVNGTPAPETRQDRPWRIRCVEHEVNSVHRQSATQEGLPKPQDVSSVVLRSLRKHRIKILIFPDVFRYFSIRLETAEFEP